MKIKIFQVDAFTSRLFSGNPAAVCPLNHWLKDDTMQAIATENNLSETAFFVKEGNSFSIRWFTPGVEVNLCGHATLASGHVLFNHLNYSGNRIEFQSKSGPLSVHNTDDLLTLDFPASPYMKIDPSSELIDALGKTPVETYRSDDYLVLLDSEEEVREIIPDFNLLTKLDARGIIITAPGIESDFVSRFFAPAVGINEDPVTGSAHTLLTPFWAEKLGKNKLTARQLSLRGGELYCKHLGDRVEISGRAITYLIGEIII